MTSHTDEEWTQLLAVQDSTATAELWTKVVEWGVTSARKRDQSEDLGKDAAVQAFIRITKFLGSYAGTGSFLGWCRLITMREVLRLIDNQQKQVATLDDPTTPFEQLSTEDATLRLDEASVQARIQPCLDRLGKQEKRVIDQFYFRQADPQKIAEEMGIARNYVHQLLHRARLSLKKCFVALGFHSADDVLSL